MLRSVRGLIGVSLLLGLVAAALPYIAAAAFGPMVQVIANAGESGNLSGVWDFRGPLVARQDGLLRSVAGSVPFGVLLAVWAGAPVDDSDDVLRQHLGRHEGRPCTARRHPPTRARPPANAVAGLLHQVAQWRADPASDRRTGRRTTPPHRLSASAADRHGGPDRGDRLSAGHLMADDGCRTCAHTAGPDRAEDRGPRCPGRDATGDERRPRDGRRARADGQRDRRDPDVQCRAAAQQAISQRCPSSRLRARRIRWCGCRRWRTGRRCSSR